MVTRVEALSRFPVKGLSGQDCKTVRLEPGKGFSFDRQFGFARPNSGFSPNDPKPLPKTKFYMLARDSKLALLKTSFDPESFELTITAPEVSGRFLIATDQGKKEASLFIKTYLSLPDDETPQLYEASPHKFTDVSVVSPEMMNAVSIINIDSVSDFSKMIACSIDPKRFRGNIHISGLPPFSELDMVGRQFTIGTARLKIVMRTKRCPATEVDLDKGERDIGVRELLQENYGHTDMGVYAEVLDGGVISAGDVVEFL